MIEDAGIEIAIYEDMGLIDAMIIYLTIGAPFAVYEMTKRDCLASAAVKKAIVTGLLWPLAAVRTALDRDRRDKRVDDELTAIRSMIEDVSGSADGSYSSIVDVRNTFDTYTGLAIAASQPVERPPAAEMLRIAGSDAETVAIACLTRREREKLRTHLVLARIAFVDMIENLMILPEAKRLEAALPRLADHLNDPDLIDDLNLIGPSTDLQKNQPIHGGVSSPAR